jgi:hypothetical protein
MKTRTLVVDERELSTIRAALLLLQEQVDALPEDLAEMVTAHGKPMRESEIEHLTLRLTSTADQNPDYTSGHIHRLIVPSRLSGSLEVPSFGVPPEPSACSPEPKIGMPILPEGMMSPGDGHGRNEAARSGHGVGKPERQQQPTKRHEVARFV